MNANYYRLRSVPRSSRPPTGFKDVSCVSGRNALRLTDSDGDSFAIGPPTSVDAAPVHGVKAAINLVTDTTNAVNGSTVKVGDKTYTYRVFVTSNTLTLADTPHDGDTVTICGQVYTFKGALTAATTANQVLIGTSANTALSAAAALDNLKAAVNKDTGGGTVYGSNTVANEYCTATTNANDSQLFVAKGNGTSYNALVVGAAGAGVAHYAWASTDTGLFGGTGATSISTGGTTEGDVCIGANAEASLLNLARAINHHADAHGTGSFCAAAHPTVTSSATVSAGTTITLTAIDAGVLGNSIDSVGSSSPDSHIDAGAAHLAGGVDCTTAAAGDMLYYNGYAYMALIAADITTTSGVWVKWQYAGI